ncbi:hypothetical protein PQ465_16260 [Sphingobacterium oryzagri]|uniref:Transglutaminase-like superfamily protein n=1 Tax=Sphingobacterium oryzagri TaxID=3025669 RepID=A0ABY7WH33_9SPHI|nr:hypothetical protein [Sphingobacterium sp. KACC 22765]WDF67842.1 hypothetical protein PQ465_16260 [Sphingobacterium sp. KACC 22765]
MKSAIRQGSIGKLLLWSFLFFANPSLGQSQSFDFFERSFTFTTDSTIYSVRCDSATTSSINRFYQQMDSSNYNSILQSLTSFKETHELNDWFYYQLIRKLAQSLSAKSENYDRYTLFKWFFLVKSGYDARLATRDGQLILYVRSEDEIFDLPYFKLDGHTYICLNYHDYGDSFNVSTPYMLANIFVPEVHKSFSYQVTKLPEFKAENYKEKDIAFHYKGKAFHFKLRINEDVNDIFKNYPVVDYGTYFNIPVSPQTYASLIPALRTYTKGLSVEKGVDYLMRFTRYSFLYEDDRVIYGKEKRLSPEQTLINEASDCDDRAALFFYLVKEIYNLPMIALRYPSHITVAVQFDKTIGKGILYAGSYYTICEPTPQKTDLALGELAEQNSNEHYEIVYHYTPH